MFDIRSLAIASVSLLALATPVAAQDVPADGATEDAVGGAEIIVQARRRDESAQDVPLVVNAVTAENLDRLNIRDFRDVQSVVPGLQLTPAANGSQSSASIRGLNNDVTAAGSNGTVQFYQNDAPISLSTLLTTMFDVGQIEVLRGPQGTLRGRAAPSGSITVTTKRPDLDEVGGYINMTGQTHGAINVNAAVGVPIIRDVLAVRFAALHDANNNNRIESLTNGRDPYSRTTAQRVTLSFAPLESLTFNGSFTNLRRSASEFIQVESGNLFDPTIAASPTAISAEDRLSVSELGNSLRMKVKVWNWQADYRFAGQRLAYVGSYNDTTFDNFTFQDAGNRWAGFPAAVRSAGQPTLTRAKEESHEVRLQSDERIFGMFDYVLGGFLYKTKPVTDLEIQTPVFFGAPSPASLLLVNRTAVVRASDTTEKSAFFNLTAHLGEATELSGGVRYIDYEAENQTIIGAATLNNPVRDSQWIYSVSAKHRFSDSFMVYASVGSSWRPGAASNSVIDTNAAPSPIEAAWQGVQPSETSTSYEIGFKSDLFDRRVRLNVSAFHQDFKNYIFFAPDIFVAYTDPGTGAQNARLLSGLGVGVPAKVDGVEGELTFRASDRWNLGLSAAYARSRIKNGVIPCNNFEGTASYASITEANGGETIGSCAVNFSAARAAPFSATAQSEYAAPVTTGVDGFLRGLATFNGKSKGDPTNAYDDVKAYALVNLYAGIRSPEGDWEVSFYAKNLFDTDRVLTRNANVEQVGYSAVEAPSGNLFSTYRRITMNAPREFGLNVRFAFGSR